MSTMTLPLAHPLNHPTPSSYIPSVLQPFSLAGPSTSPRPRHTSTSEMPPPSTLPARKRKLAPGGIPAPSSPSVSETSADPADTEYEPSPSARSLPKRSKAAASGGHAESSTRTGAGAGASGSRASGSGGGGRAMSREALRKANHSLIERRRREKINSALSELRDMVPGLGDAGGGKGGEFKLEVLERTVAHMKDLKAHIADVEARLVKCTSTTSSGTSRSSSASKARPRPPAIPPCTVPPAPSPPKRKYSTSPPTPSQSPDRDPGLDSPDPNETDLESNLPPPLTIASRPPLPPSHSTFASPSRTPTPPGGPSRTTTPSITSLLASLPDRSAHPVPSARPQASSLAHNPTLYLPFPTPSPTSPFLSYGQSSCSSSSGPPEPSPFIAPLQNMPLFGGALSLDSILATSPTDVLGISSHDSTSHTGSKAGTGGIGSRGRLSSKEQEEAANVLLAFSSPDVMRPSAAGLGMTPLMTPIFAAAEEEDHSAELRRRGTLDCEEFVLDGGVVGGKSGTANKRKAANGGVGEIDGEVRGKTAREILKM